MPEKTYIVLVPTARSPVQALGTCSLIHAPRYMVPRQEPSNVRVLNSGSGRIKASNV